MGHYFLDTQYDADQYDTALTSMENLNRFGSWFRAALASPSFSYFSSTVLANEKSLFSA